ncbi:hypothetical protein ACVGW2_14620, partial [Enterobacter intestinihominis]
GEQKVVGLEVNANHIRSVRSGRVPRVFRAHHPATRQHVWHLSLKKNSHPTTHAVESRFRSFLSK